MKNILNYKKPAFWIVAAVVVAVTVSVSLLANSINVGQGYIPITEETLPSEIIVRSEFPSYPVGTNDIKLILQNNTDTDLYYGSHYAIEKYNPGKGQWFQVPFAKNVAFNGMLYSLKAHIFDRFFVHLSMLKNKPDAGKYRIWFLDDRITCEFDLVDDPAFVSVLLPDDMTIVAWSDRQFLQGRVITETNIKQIVMDVVMNHLARKLYFRQ